MKIQLVPTSTEYHVSKDGRIVGKVSKHSRNGARRSGNAYWLWVPAEGHLLSGAEWCDIDGHKTREEAVQALLAWKPPTVNTQVASLEYRITEAEKTLAAWQASVVRGTPWNAADQVAEAEGTLARLRAQLTELVASA